MSPGKLHRFKRNESFVSPYDVGGLREVYQGHPPVFLAIRDRDLDRVYELTSR